MKNQTTSQSWPMNQAAWMTRLPRLGGPRAQGTKVRCSISCPIGSPKPLKPCASWASAVVGRTPLACIPNGSTDTLTDYSAQSTKVAAINVKQGADAAQGRQRRH